MSGQLAGSVLSPFSAWLESNQYSHGWLNGRTLGESGGARPSPSGCNQRTLKVRLPKVLLNYSTMLSDCGW